MLFLSIVLHTWFRSKFEFRKLSHFLISIFLNRNVFFEQNKHFSQKVQSIWEVQTTKQKFSNNLGHNILELYNALVQIRFATSKTKLDIEYNKLGIRVASRVAKQLKTQNLRKLENIVKISSLAGDIAPYPVSLSEIKRWQQQLKNTKKQICNFSFPVQFYCIFLLWSNISSGIVDLMLHFIF